MAKKSSKSDRKSSPRKNQENLKNRGYEEDQPHNPVRSSGSVKKESESLPTGEPDPDEVDPQSAGKGNKKGSDAEDLEHGNLTGPGLG